MRVPRNHRSVDTANVGETCTRFGVHKGGGVNDGKRRVNDNFALGSNAKSPVAPY